MNILNSNPRMGFAVERREPYFLARRVDHYYNERIPKAADGGHPAQRATIAEGGVLLCTNDYLSIGQHPDIVAAQTYSLLRNGAGMVMSSVFQLGDSVQHQCEVKLAQFMHAEDAMLCQSGWAANVGLIQSIADETTPVYIDMLAHTSLWEGIRAAKAKTVMFRHNNAESLEKNIQRHGTGIVVIDALYSTLGDYAPITAIIEVAEKYGCIMVIDEAHSLGVNGENGEGLVVELGLTDRVHFRTASLAKAFAGRGGVIVGSKRHIEYIRYESRPAVFSSGLLAHEADTFSATIDVIKREKWRRNKLRRNAAYLKTHLSTMGYNVDISESQIIGLEGGHIRYTNLMRQALESYHIYGAAFWEPATAKNRSLLRLTVTASLSMEQLNYIVAACYAVRDKVRLNEWSSTQRKLGVLAKRTRSETVRYLKEPSELALET